MEELIKYLEEKKKEYAHNIFNLPFNIRMERQGRIKAYVEIINYIDNVKNK